MNLPNDRSLSRSLGHRLRIESTLTFIDCLAQNLFYGHLDNKLQDTSTITVIFRHDNPLPKEKIIILMIMFASYKLNCNSTERTQYNIVYYIYTVFMDPPFTCTLQPLSSSTVIIIVKSKTYTCIEKIVSSMLLTILALFRLGRVLKSLFAFTLHTGELL